MEEKIYLSLQSSEAAILHAASRIFSGYVASNKVTDKNEQELIDKSIDNAISMAKSIDEQVQSDEELG